MRLGALRVLHRVGAGALGVEEAEEAVDVDLLAGGVEDVAVAAGATAMRSGGCARSRSTTLMGRPLCSETALQASTAALMEPSTPSPAARIRYSEAGLPRPVGL